MTRWLLSLTRCNEINRLTEQARINSALGVACAAKDWPESAAAHRQRRNLAMWAARELAMRPSKRRSNAG